MGLTEYDRKRRFNETPEPPPRLDTENRNRFCVQRHHATRLHYDFRLEADGVLKSWAIPRGPSLDPADKRSAAHVEDHPVEYLTFEGVIPHGNYGAGSVMLWDLGTYESYGEGTFAEQYEKGNLKFILHGEKLKGAFALVRTKQDNGKNWLLIKKKDDAAVPGWDVEDYAHSIQSGLSQAEIARGATGSTWSSTTGREPPSEPAERPSLEGPVDMPAGAVERAMPRELNPMLPCPAKPFSSAEWIFELKWDGVRALTYATQHSLLITSRRGNPITRQYPELEALHLNVAADSFVLDGEIVALNERGEPEFGRLQPRMHASVSQALTLSRRTPVTYYVFDLLYLNGWDLRGVPLFERRRLLRQVLRPDATVRISDEVDEKGEMLFELARQRGLEGVVAKKKDSHYEDGRRSDCWLKIKTTASLEAVVGGYTRPVGGREKLGSIALGLYQNGHLVPIGQAGTGFTEQTIAFVLEQFEPLKTEACPFTPCPKVTDPIQWVQPRLVCEVKYNAWTQDRKLRGAVYVRLRDDKDPVECTFQDQGEKAPDDVPAAAQATGYEPLLTPEAPKQVVNVESRLLTFTNLDKLMYPDDKVTKRDVINFYDRISKYLLPYLKDRPLNLKRYPNGINGPFFFQRHANERFPAWLPTTRFENTEGVWEETFMAQDRATLLYLVNLGCIDQNMWISRSQTLDQPDFLLLDLDPQDCPYDLLVDAALALKEVLDVAGLKGYPKTSGGRGFHIWVPVVAGYTFEQTRMLAQAIAYLAAQRHPKMFTFPRAVDKREKGRVYLDFPHNRRGSSIAAPYVIRAWPGVAVATPLEWQEVRRGLDPKRFTMFNIFDRLEKKGDLFRPVLDAKQRLEDAIERLGGMV